MPFPSAKVEARTQRLLLRPIAISDAAEVHLIRSDAEVMHLTSPKEDDIAQTTATVQSWLDSGRWGFAIELLPSEHAKLAAAAGASTSTPKVVGYISLRAPAEIGYAMNRACWGKGYAREAFEAFMDLVWEHADPEEFDHVYARTDPENGASIKLLENVGFTFTGIHPEKFWIEHLGWRDSAVYRCNRPEAEE